MKIMTSILSDEIFKKIANPGLAPNYLGGTFGFLTNRVVVHNPVR